VIAVEVIIKAAFILTGIILILVVLLSLARRKMTETFCLMWGILALIIICAGIFLSPSGWSSLIGPVGTFLIFLATACIIWGAFFICIQVSMLMRKNQEMAMQISLLNQENKQMLDELAQREEDGKDEEKENLVCSEYIEPGRSRSGVSGDVVPYKSKAV
jgi:predicted ferric reductase